MIDTRDAHDAAALVAYALGGRIPSDGSEYGGLLARYRGEVEFALLVDAIASGLRLDVLGNPRTGLVLAPADGSVFDIRLGDLRPKDPDDRLVFGLVLLGVAALAYPNEEELDVEGVARPISIERVERFMRAAVAPLAAAEAEAESIEAFAASAARAYDTMPPIIRTAGKGQLAKGCTTKVIRDVFDLLVEQKMARLAERYGANTYTLNDRFRIGVREVAGSAALDTLRGIARLTPSEA